MSDITIYSGGVSVIDTFRKFDKEALARLDSVDREIVQANDFKRFQEYEQGELVRDLAKVMQLALRDIGYKGTQDDIKYILVTAARLLPKYFGTLTMRDFSLAFELLSVGELDGYLPRNTQGEPDKKHFNNVNADYISRVMNAYKKRRNEALNNAQKVRPAERELPNPEKEEAAGKEIAARLQSAIDYYRENGQHKAISRIDEKLFYELLESRGEVEHIEAPKDEQAKLINIVITEKANGCLKWTDTLFEKFLNDRRRLLREAIEKLSKL